ncbi:MAG: transposase [Pedobacter sp.]|nr:transposase [Pedobacter sp.]MDQ8053476.1 transposase [Pedobacter sp.]
MSKAIALEEGLFYHIYNRGNNKERIFKDEDDYRYFLSLLKKHLLPTADIFVYCLLGNHFHLLVKIKTNEIDKGITGKPLNTSQVFSNLFNAYAKAFNRKYNRTGKLFEERFKRKQIATDGYFSELIYYIHANPQRHQLIGDFRNYAHSSYPVLTKNEFTFINRDEVLNWFGGKDLFERFHEERVVYLLNYQNFEK